MAVKRKFAPLGRGLDALISTEDIRTDGSSTISEVPIGLIDANPNQPRREFDEAALAELSESIAEIGIVQPITLRQKDDGRYEIIAGERRWRASLKAGLKSVPAYIRTADDEKVLEMALVENIQRQDLNAIEIALAYEHLMEQYGLTQEKLAERVGKNRATVANSLRLLKLPAPVQVALRNGTIDMGHARALLALDDPTQQIRLFQEIQQKGYSVRQVEELVRAIKAGKAPKQKDAPAKANAYDGYVQQLAQTLSSKVKITSNAKGAGKLTIPFKSETDLQRLVQLLSAQ